ncbi:MAG TPA: hypothetical protein VFW45_01825 [Candidatus Polarisedimenticolia bacterium]|nr:hypothetical protein [Candidatus Polarisedimenticolia bacterium]
MSRRTALTASGSPSTNLETASGAPSVVVLSGDPLCVRKGLEASFWC